MADGIRRRALVAAALAAAIALAAVKARAEAPMPTPDTAAAPAIAAAGGDLVPGVRLLPGTYAPPRQPDGNSILFAAPDGWVAFDSGRHPAHAGALLALADDGPVAVLVNSHWHLDHVGGNPAIRAAHPGLEVIASPAIDAALGDFLALYAQQLRDALATDPDAAAAADWRAELARIEDGAALRPDRALTATADLRLAGRAFRLGVEPLAATAGDVWLLDRDRRVLAAGDLVTLPAPFFDTACADGWEKALANLQAQEFDLLVPGHGAPMTPADLQVYRDAFSSLVRCAGSPAPAATCIDGWLQASAPLLASDGERAQARRLLEYYLPQVLRSPVAATLCRAATPA